VVTDVVVFEGFTENELLEPVAVPNDILGNFNFARAVAQ
jgi:hypothetical protein